MNSKKFFRMHMMVAGLGAALLLGGAAYAQEIDSATFSDGPHVAPMPQPASAKTPSEFAKTEISYDTRALAGQEPAGATTQEASIGPWRQVDGLAMLGIPFSVLLVFLYALAEARHNNRLVRAQRSPFVPLS
jgi:hypothetical protein